MAYDESTFRRRESSSATSTSYQTGGYPTADYTGTDPVGGLGRTGHRAQPTDVYADPLRGEPGRDRMAVHLIWEILLLVAAATLAILVYRADSAALRGARLDDLLVQVTAFGLLALGAGMSLRVNAANLALGPTAVIAAVHFAHQGKAGVLPSTSVAVGVAAAAGLLLALFIVGFHVPAWAASLGAALGGIVWIQQIDGPIRVTGEFNPADRSVLLFVGFAVVAVLVAAFGTVNGVRRAIGRFRPISDPARRRGAAAGSLVVLATVSSMILAAMAGVLFAANSGPSVVAGPGLELTGLALGVAMLGGTSAFGRRGGVFGTVFATIALCLFLRYDDVRGWDISLLAVAAATLAGGLIVTRLVETHGRPDPVGEHGGELAGDGWVSATSRGSTSYGLDDLTSASGFGRPSRPDSWSSALPAQSTTSRGDAWDEDRWGTASR